MTTPHAELSIVNVPWASRRVEPPRGHRCGAHCADVTVTHITSAEKPSLSGRLRDRGTVVTVAVEDAGVDPDGPRGPGGGGSIIGTRAGRGRTAVRSLQSSQ